jgi:hypothetical protein
LASNHCVAGSFTKRGPAGSSSFVMTRMSDDYRAARASTSHFPDFRPTPSLKQSLRK